MITVSEQTIKIMPNYLKVFVLMIADLCSLLIFYYLLFHDISINYFGLLGFSVLLIFIYWLLGVYNFSVRNCTLNDLLSGAIAVFASISVSTILLFWLSNREIVLSNLVLLVLLSANAFILIRLSLRYVYRKIIKSGTIPVIFVDLDENTENVIHSMFASKYFKPVAIISPGNNITSKRILGLSVYRLDDLKWVLEKYKPEIVFLPTIVPEPLAKPLFDYSLTYKYALKKLPKLLDSLLAPQNLENIDILAFLNRIENKAAKSKIMPFFQNQVVMITGSGGSIGSELAYQVAACAPRKLVLLDSSEHAIFQIQTKLQHAFPELDLITKIGDVCEDLSQFFDQFQIHTVLHAAALKHVPLVEENVNRAIKTNVFGTRNVLETSHSKGVKNFVLISTDKAVRSTNVMGATKRLAELICISFARDRTINFNNLMVSAVRFGNVLGSSGSVLTTFERQIALGGPVTVTDPEITRYFMSIPEAASLVLRSATLKNNGAVHLLDMGQPIKILELAKSMIVISGFTPVVEPNLPSKSHEILIQFSGLRPGEKLYEELLVNSSAIKTNEDKISIAFEEGMDVSTLADSLSRLEKLLIKGSTAELKEELRMLPLGYKPTKV